jgi:hypothetical protein
LDAARKRLELAPFDGDLNELPAIAGFLWAGIPTFPFLLFAPLFLAIMYFIGRKMLTPPKVCYSM